MTLITTPQAADLLGVTPTTVKRWVDDGRLQCLRTAGGHRRFDRGEVQRFLALSGGRADDFASRLVETLLDGSDRYSVQSQLTHARGRLGSWWAVADQVGACLDAIGREWHSGRCSIATEHAASHCLQAALSACLATLPAGDPERRCLLVAIEEDYHTLGLSLAELCAAEAGWCGVWLGGPTPTHTLARAVERQRPAAVAVSASAWSSDEVRVATRYRAIAETCRARGAKLVLGGRGAWPQKLPYGFRLQSFEAFARLLGGH